MTVPAGVTTLTPGSGTPAATCTRSTVAGATVFNCTVNQDLNVGVTWAYNLTATGGNTPGTYTAVAAITKPDSNPANDRDDAPVTLFAIRDVAVNITASPDNNLVGSGFTYTVNM